MRLAKQKEYATNHLGRKAKSTEINKINISPCESITKAKDIANTLNTHFT